MKGWKDGPTLLATVPGRALPAISIEVGNQRLTALIDTGAAHCVLHERFAQQPLQGARSAPLAAAGQQLLFSGAEDMEIVLEGRCSHVTFQVSPQLAVDCILGCPWLEANEATIDMKRRCVHLGTTHRHTLYFVTAAPEGRDKAVIHLDDFDHGFPTEQLPEFESLLQRYGHLFGRKPHQRSKTTPYQIQLKDQTPIRSRPYRISDEKKRIVQAQITNMLQEGIITPSTSPYSSPIVLVPKQDGSMRFCVDYRRVNEATISMPATMPVISETLQDLGDAQVFSSLDLEKGYWQIPLEDSSKAVTAFSTPDGGHYQFEVLPFGLRNAPAKFQHTMSQEVLAGFLRKFAMVYSDNFIVYSKNHEEHLRHLALVFERLQEYGLRLSPTKCEFGKTHLPYLGHVIARDTTRPTTKHLRQIAEQPVPKTRKELRSFIGLCNWLRDYVPRFAEISAPLTELLATKRSFRWTSEAEEAFRATQEAFSQPLQLHRPLPDLPYILQTDASGVGIAAVLYQQDQEQRRIISYASTKLSRTEARYHINEQECLALVWAVRRYRPLLEGRRFTVRTDSRALTWLARFKDTKTKLLRWALLLQEFDFAIEHCPGEQNQLADVLSRDPEEVTAADDPDEHLRLLPPGINALLDEPLPVQVMQAQKTDALTRRMIERLGDPDDPDAATLAETMAVLNGHLWRRSGDGVHQLYVPTGARRTVMACLHDDVGHPGRDETARAISHRYYWPQMSGEITKYVQRCITCAAVKPGAARLNAPLQPRTPTAPWQSVSVDLMGPYPKTRKGKTNILVVTDMFTRWVEAFAIGEPKTSVITRLMEENVFHRFGYPKIVLTDNGRQFTGHHWHHACRQWGATPYRTGIYHPRANPVERRNQELKKGLRVRLQGQSHTRWAQHLPAILRDLRTRRNAATGYTPSEALLGYTLPLPGEHQLLPDGEVQEMGQPAREVRLEDIRQHQLTYQQRYAGGEPQEPLQVGAHVMVRAHPQSDARKGVHAGFHPRWLGPYTIREVHSGRVYTVDRDGHDTRIPAYDIKPAPPPEDEPQVPASVLGSDPEDN